jgi:AAA15 family ATPase/GTPase
MLLRFGVKNHRSIRSYQEISLVASSLRDVEDGLISPEADVADSSPRRSLRLVPVLALYGANASGKTTILDALQFFASGIVSSHDRSAGRTVPFRPFLLDDESRKADSRYDADIILDGVRYHYGYSITRERIESEWLYSFPISGARRIRTVLFTRDAEAEEEFHFGKSLKGENKVISKLVRPNSLFLSAAAQNSHPQLSEIFNFFAEKVTNRMQETSEHMLPEQLLAYFGEDEALRERAVSFLAAADTGIVGLDFSKVPVDEKSLAFVAEFERVLNNHLDGAEINVPKRTEHAKVGFKHLGSVGKKYPIEMDRESAGTIALLGLLGPVLKRLSEGGVLVIDELNSTLHPLVSREIIRLFSDPTTNPGKAQLLFSTHDTNLLAGGLLRRDQIWFAEKDLEGATHAYSLSEIKVRRGDNFEAGYLQGRFGAIPFFGLGDSFLEDERGENSEVAG